MIWLDDSPHSAFNNPFFSNSEQQDNLLEPLVLQIAFQIEQPALLSLLKGVSTNTPSIPIMLYNNNASIYRTHP